MLGRCPVATGIVYSLTFASVAGAFVSGNHSKSVIERLDTLRNSLQVENIPVSARKKLHDIQLICPRAGNGTLIHISKNLNGVVVRYDVNYSNGKAIHFRLSGDVNKGEGLRMLLDVDTVNSTVQNELNAAAHMLKDLNKTQRNICNGSREQRARYRTDLDANKKLLGISERDFPSDF
jgi:hypothetical protein